ncbi:hypothetical protein ACGFMM_35495 [Streptomyces sp. NPDC048604]
MGDITEQAMTCMTDAEREELSRKVAETNRRSEQGRGGGQS